MTGKRAVMPMPFAGNVAGRRRSVPPLPRTRGPMDILTFIAKMAEALAWPLVALVIFHAVREPLAALLPNVRKLRFQRIEAEFGEQMSEIEKKVAALPEDVQPAPMPESEESKLISLAEIAPKAAVIEAWRAVDRSAKRLIEQRGHKLDYDTPQPFSLIERVLDRGGILESPQIKIFRDLRQLRNKVAHAEEFTISNRQAVEYVRVAMTLRRYLDALAQTATPA